MALVVGSILVGYAFELYVFSRRIVTHWRKQAEVSELVHSTLNRMTLDLQRADNLEIQGDSVFVIRSDSRVIALYRSSGGSIARNDVMMNVPASVPLFVYSTRVGDLVSIEVKGRSGSKELTATNRASLQTSSAGKFKGAGVVGSKVP